MVVQKYLKSGANERLKSVKSDSSKKCKELCQHLGLERQANLYDQGAPQEFYPELTGHELWVWRRFLPTMYSHYTWKNYVFDLIPLEVLEEIQFADSLNLFDTFSIWTPERRVQDPIAVGIYMDRIFQIVRWGESLKPFTEIELDVKKDFLNLTSDNGIDRLPEKVAKAISDYQHKLFLEHRMSHPRFSWLTLFKRHCGKRMYKFHDYGSRHINGCGYIILICSECAFITKKEFQVGIG